MQPSDLEIARAAKTLPITEIASRLGLSDAHLSPYDHDKAKLRLDLIGKIPDRPSSKLILVTAINPTPAGEGKTTTTVGLGDGLNRIGKKSLVCLREPSLGPCFGVKGGAAGGGYAQVVPMEDINLHFTGDFHAITAAHNLLAAMVDNHIYWGNALEIDLRRIALRRVLDVNDRALRQVVTGLGGVANGFSREAGFDITVASEVMAIFCLATSLKDLEARLGQIIVGYRRDKSPVFCKDLNAEKAMTVLLQKAFSPNLVQTLENNPALIHGGPFANIAHGCNSVMATQIGLKLADYVVTEAGFGADLGAEKFFNIKCRSAGLKPSAAVLVATVRALKVNGGVALTDLGKPDIEAVVRGSANLARHIANIKQFGVPVVVAINHFVSDSEEEIAAVVDCARAQGVEAIVSRHWSDGSAGSQALAHKVVEIAEANASQFSPLYADDLPLFEKINAVVKRIYRGSEAIADKAIRTQLQDWQNQGYGHLPICMAKTQYSFSTDPNLRGAPTDHAVPIREVRLCAGAGFVVVVCGAIMTMPGLPRVPAAERIGLDDDGLIQNLF